jgi:hypothetical protein
VNVWAAEDGPAAHVLSLTDLMRKHMTERALVTLAAAVSGLILVLAVAAVSWAGNANWLFLGGISIALGSVGAFFALRQRRWLAATANVLSAVAGVWMLIVITNFEGS